MHLLARGARSAGLISRSLNLKRPTVYSALHALEERNLIAKTEGGTTAEFVAIPPDEIPTVLLSEVKKDFEKIVVAVELLKPRLDQFKKYQHLSTRAFEVKYYDCPEDYQHQLAKYIHTNDFCAIWNPQVAIPSEQIRNRVEWFLRETAKQRNHVKDLLVAGPTTDWYRGNIKNPNHEVRVSEGGYTGIADLVILPDMVLISLNPINTGCALEIKNEHYAEMMRWHFNLLWKNLPSSDVTTKRGKAS